LSRDPEAAGESVLGQIIADAQLAATRAGEDGSAVIALTNPGGIRAGLQRSAEGVVTYADLFAAQPFGNNLVTLTLTGAQIKTLLEQQWLDQPKPRILQVSKGFSYVWDDRRPRGDFVPAGSIALNGRTIEPAGSYRVTVNAFLADGGDGFQVLKDGRDPRPGPFELAALEAYFKANSPIGLGPLDRIRRAY
jgi:5'-nucleotidase